MKAFPVVNSIEGHCIANSRGGEGGARRVVQPLQSRSTERSSYAWGELG
jgi:hypothetical protein